MSQIDKGRAFLELLLADDELAHYGTLGMKWGRRKDQRSSGERAKAKVAAKVKKVEKREHLSVARNAANRDVMAGKSVKGVYSEKSDKLSNRASGLAIGGVGAFLVGHLISDPRVKAGAFATSIVLSGASIGTSVAAGNSVDKDVVNAYTKNGNRTKRNN